MTDNQLAYEELKKGIQTYVEHCLDNYPNDITYTGIVIAVRPFNLYNIKINGVTYNNISTIGGTCVKNELVKVLVPQGNYSAMVILKGGGGDGSSTPSITDYEDLTSKPSINGIILSGDKSLDDLGIKNIDSYDELNNIPSINNVTLSGNKTSSELGLLGTNDIGILSLTETNDISNEVFYDYLEVLNNG